MITKIFKENMAQRQMISDMILEGAEFTKVISHLRSYLDPRFDESLYDILLIKTVMSQDAKDNLVKGLKTLSYERRGLTLGYLVWKGHPARKTFMMEMSQVYNLSALTDETPKEYAERFLSALIMRSEPIVEKALKRCERSLI